MTAIGETGLQALVLDRLGHLARQNHCAQRQRGAGQPLGERHQVGASVLAVPLPGEPLAAASERAHDLVRDQPDAARGGLSAERRPVVVGCDDAVRAGVGLHQDCDDCVPAFSVDAVSDRRRRTGAALLVGVAAERTPVRIGRRDVSHAERGRIDVNLRAAVARERHREVTGAVVGPVARHDQAARPTPRLSHDLGRVLVRIGAARSEEHAPALETGQLEKPPRERHAWFGAPGVGDEAEPLGLLADRGDQARVLVPEIAALREAGEVENLAAVLEDELCAPTAHDGGRGPVGLHAPAVQHHVAFAERQ